MRLHKKVENGYGEVKLVRWDPITVRLEEEKMMI